MLLRIFFLLSLTLAVVSEEREQPSVATSPPVVTFSIVAVDPDTGEIGVGVQSKIVGVGSIVPFAKAGVGAVATQSFANTGYGPLGLRAFSEEIAPEKVIQILTADDPMRERRQVGVINAKGKAANFTGKGCHGWAGGIVGVNFAAQGNILTGSEVIEEMARAFEETDGVLAERLIEALRAGQAAGGDSRGRQSAALLIVRDGWGYGGIDDRFRDIRIDEHETPIEELERVYRKHRNLFPRPE
jgi:uncharacterized Ntn-hydrolase superfamily protein